jgi:antimicrobial peptide system SdpA family protein
VDDNRRDVTPLLRAYIVMVYGVMIVVALYILVGNLPYSALQLPGSQYLELRAVVPEGWAFFTRNPRELRTSVYHRPASREWRIASDPQFSAPMLFGFRRTSRAVGMEAAQLLETAGSVTWRDCAAASAGDCLQRLGDGDAIPVRNRAAAPALCGDVAILLQEPLPWAWARSTPPVHMPLRLVRLRVQC